MAKAHSGEEILPKPSTPRDSSRVHERYDRQTDSHVRLKTGERCEGHVTSNSPEAFPLASCDTDLSGRTCPSWIARICQTFRRVSVLGTLRNRLGISLESEQWLRSRRPCRNSRHCTADGGNQPVHVTRANFINHNIRSQFTNVYKSQDSKISNLR